MSGSIKHAFRPVQYIEIQRKLAPALRVFGKIWKKAFLVSAKHPRLLLSLKLIFVFLIFWVASWSKFYDPDFGWHLQAGNYIRAHGIPATDLFSYTANTFRWIDHEWLSDVILSRVFATVGYNGLAVMYATMWTAALFIVKAHKRFIFVVIAALAMLPYSGVRATTWTVLCLAILIYILSSKNKKLKFLLPGLFLLWANLHGGFFIGLAVMVFHCLKQRHWEWVYVLLLSILATFVNPYGPKLYDEIFRTAFDSSLRWQIAEWFPAKFLLLVMPFIFSLIWAVGFVIKNRKPVLKSVISLSLLFFLASLSSNRHFPLFVLIAAPELDGYYQHLKRLLPKNLDFLRKAILMALPVLVLLVTSWSLYTLALRVHYGQARENPYPQKAVAYLKQNPCPGNIFNHYNYGGYLIWKLPGVPLYIDGRMPSWRDDGGQKFFDRYKAIESDQTAVNGEEFKRYGIRCIIWPSTNEGVALISSLKNSKWQKIEEASNDSSSLWLAPKYDYQYNRPTF